MSWLVSGCIGFYIHPGPCVEQNGTLVVYETTCKANPGFQQQDVANIVGVDEVDHELPTGKTYNKEFANNIYEVDAEEPDQTPATNRLKICLCINFG